MANSLNASVNFNGLIAGVSFPIAKTISTVPAGGTGLLETATIATSATAVTAASLALGYVVIVNLDATNTIHVSCESSAATTPQVVQPGGFIVLSPGNLGVWAIAQTASVQIAYLALSI